MTSKEALIVLRAKGVIDNRYCKKIELNKCLNAIEKDLDILEIFKRIVIGLVFNDEPYCNLVLTDVENCIDVDYDSKAPDVEMTWEEYIKVKEWLEK